MRRIVLTAVAALLAALSVTGRPLPYDPWVLTASDTTGRYYGVPVANGAIGMMPGKELMSVKSVILNNVYDARRTYGVSSMFNNLNPFVMSLSVDGHEVKLDGVIGWSQVLDMRRASFTNLFVVPDKAVCSWTLRALRALPYSGLITLKVKALKDIDLELGHGIETPAKGFNDTTATVFKQNIRGQKYFIDRSWATTRRRGVLCSAAQCLFTADGPAEKSVRLSKGEEYTVYLAASVCSGQNFADPLNEPTREVIYAIGEGPAKLIARHEALWDELWQGDIVIDGDDQAQQIVHSAIYQLYSQDREGLAASIPPFGMSCREYCGHIFWDTELWMYPPMLFLNGGIARSMMDYRTQRLEGARRRAATYGYRGAMFPWESDATGEEACPVEALTGTFEHHISACVAIGVWNYYRMTRDEQWLREQGWPVLEGVADFWVSRAERNGDGSYSVRNVVCADEFASGVDDNAFTNGAAICALRAAVKAAGVLGKESDPRWTEVADALRILRSEDGVTIEHEGYDGRTIKQADANLLAYPLGLITDEAAIRKDLEYYTDRILPTGPAMSYGVLAVQWARLGDGQKAYELYKRTLEGHLHGPLLSFSETAGHGDVYFMTGLGGFLQAIINGFCGLELTDDGIVQLPSVLPKGWKSVTVKGVGPERKSYTNKKH